MKSQARIIKPTSSSSSPQQPSTEKFYNLGSPNPSTNFVSSPPARLSPLRQSSRGFINAPLSDFHDLYSSVSRLNGTSSQEMPAVLRDLELLDSERRSLMNENDTKAPSLIWDESSLISRSATETDDVLESKDLSSETAKMLAYALDKVEKYTSTASLANDDTKHYHRADSTQSQPNPVVVMPSTAGSTRSLRTPSRSPQQTHSYLNLAKSLPGGSPVGSERWDITRTRTSSQDMMAMASRAESEVRKNSSPQDSPSPPLARER